MNTILKLKSGFSFKKMIIASVLAISLPVASVAYAEHDGHQGKHCERGAKSHHGMHMGKPGMPMYLHGLTLSSAQEDQLFELMHAQMPNLRNQHKQHRQVVEELHAAARAEKFDEAKVQQLADKAASLEKEKVLMLARQDAKIFALLTPEQRKKAREFKGFEHSGPGHHGAFNDGDDNDKQPTRFKQPHRLLDRRNM